MFNLVNVQYPENTESCEKFRTVVRMLRFQDTPDGLVYTFPEVHEFCHWDDVHYHGKE